MTEDRIARAREIVRFLKGEGPLDGHWFGEKPAGERGNFWWRKHLADITAALASLPDDVSEEREMTDDEYAAFVRAWEETERRPLDSGFEDCVRAGFAAAIRKATA